MCIRDRGTSTRHYAPKTPFYIWSDQGLTKDDGVLIFGTPAPEGADCVWDLRNDPVQAGKQLYAVLREMDQSHLRALYVVLPDEDGLRKKDWLAIMDRLHRATQSR